MPTVISVLQAAQILAPLIEKLIDALSKGQIPDFVSTLPDPLKSRIALEARKALQK